MARPGGKDRGLFQRKGSKDWWIRWQCHLGHDHQEKIGTKSFARHMHALRRTQVKEQKFCLAIEREKRRRDEQARFDQVAERYLAWAEQHRPRSVNFRRTALGHLLRHFEGMPMAKIGKQDVEKLIQSLLDSGLSPGSINRCRSVLSHIFVKAQDWDLCDHNPVHRSTHLREDSIAPRPLTDAEEQALFAALPENLQPIILMALHTGLRLNEIRTQRWADIDLVDASLQVSQPKSGKREVQSLNNVAHTLLASLPQTADVAFPGMQTDMSNAFKRLVKKAGLPADITFHCLRDTYISRPAPYCAGPTLMALARHQNFATTQRYLRIDERHLRQAVERLSDNSESPTVAKIETEFFQDS
jgi:integrase/recombinase XerD